jgi:hypothetical protein
MSIHAVYAKISPVFRQRRMARFRAMLRPDAGESLLDVGGLPWFWRESGVRSRITLLNLPATRLEALTPATGDTPECTAVTGDGCALPFADDSFDVVVSNSVIEHVGTWTRQKAFAEEVRRVGRRLWIQTPAREFFIEPHLVAPFIHWLPRETQRGLLRNFTLRGWMDRPTPQEVEAFLAEVRLLTFAEMKTLFPDCTILRERFLGLTKSYIAVRPPA